MQKTVFKLIFLVTILIASGVQVVKAGDVTSLYLTNASFSEDVHNKATQGTDYFGNDGTFDEVAGWQREKYGWGVSATYSYGHEYTLHGKVIPASDSDGNSEGATLGIVNAWGGWVKYFQNVVLPAGDYEIIYNAFNANTGTTTINYCGFEAKNGTEYLSDSNSFTYNQWTKDTIRFSLTEDTEGKIQIGIGSANSGSADKAALFFDVVKVFSNAKNNMLASVSIEEAGELFPEFSPLVNQYVFKAEADVDTINLSALAVDEANNTLTISDDGKVALTDGTANIEITVTPNDGEPRVYTIEVTKEKKPLIDVTNAYLVNNDFTADIHNKATQGTDYFGNDGTFDRVDGWDLEKDGWGVAATYALGHTNTLHGKVIPETDADDNSEGAVLGIVNAWGGWAKYYQNVTFPAGTYEIIYNAYNANTGTTTINYSGFSGNEGSDFISELNVFPSQTWTKDTIRFTLIEETEGKIILGLGSANSGSADKAAPYFDFVKIYSTVDDIEAYKQMLSVKVDTAQQILDRGGFYASLGTGLEAAVETAEDAQSSSDLQVVITALSDINMALFTLKQGLLDYEKLAEYIQEVDIAVNTYNRSDLASYYDTLQLAYNNQLWDINRIETEIARKDSLFYTLSVEPVDNDYTIKQRIEVELVESSFPVEFAQAIAGDNHYIAYYDTDKNMCVGYRKLDETSFKKTILNSKIGWDSHNYIEMIVDDQGYIHISGNMHNVPLNYWRSSNPYDASAFDAINYMTGNEEDNVTYPKFLKTNDGELLFHYRYGWSGNGYEVYNIWEPESKTWRRFLDEALIDGKGLRNAYMSGPYYEADGYYHLYWVWRATPDAATNHDFSYARSKDLKNWENAAGEAVASPMVFNENKLKVDPSSATSGTGMLNGVQKHTLDAQNRIVLANMKYDELGNSQIYLYRMKEDGSWEEKCVSNWIYRFQFGGGGSIVFEIQLKDMRNIGDGELGLTYFHSKYGEGEIILDEETLEPIGIREVSKSYPKELDALTITGTYSKPISVKINQTGNYILRWEAMGASNDQQPSGTLPPNIMLEMIELNDATTNLPGAQANTDELKVFPSFGKYNITGLIKGDQVYIYDVNGRLMDNFIALTESQILPDLQSGFYLVSSGGKSVKVMVK